MKDDPTFCRQSNLILFLYCRHLREVQFRIISMKSTRKVRLLWNLGVIYIGCIGIVGFIYCLTGICYGQERELAGSGYRQTDLQVFQNTLNQNHYEVYNFRVNALYLSYFTGTSVSGGVFWAPRVRHAGGWSTGLVVGLSLLKENYSGSLRVFLAPEIQVLSSYQFYPRFNLEVGGGLQKWLTSDGGILPMLTTNLHYSLNGFMGIFDSVYLGYSAAWDILKHTQVRVGLQIKI